MGNYVWSAKNGKFFARLLRPDYEAAGWDLSDSIDVAESIYLEFNGNPAAGKICGVVDGMPAWVDGPGLSDEERLEHSKSRQRELRSVADSEIAWRQYAVDKGIATEREVGDLDAWSAYRVQLMRIDPAKPEWPVIPE